MTFAIDELVLRGFPSAHRHRVADALADELQTLSWEGVAPVQALPRLTLRLRAEDSPDRVGRELAHALHRALTGGRS